MIKADDGLSQGPDFYPVLVFNGSTERKGLFGPQHDNLLNNKGYPFDDTLLEVEIPMGEFAEFYTAFYDNDGDSSISEKIRDAEITQLGSYKLPDPLLQKVAENKVSPGVTGGLKDPTFWLTYKQDGEGSVDDWEEIWAVAVLIFTLGIASAVSNADDEYGSWRTRISVTPQGIFVTSKGVGAHSGLNAQVIPEVVELDGNKETAIPKLSNWIHQERHVDYSMTAQVIG